MDLGSFYGSLNKSSYSHLEEYLKSVPLENLDLSKAVKEAESKTKEQNIKTIVQESQNQSNDYLEQTLQINDDDFYQNSSAQNFFEKNKIKKKKMAKLKEERKIYPPQKSSQAKYNFLKSSPGPSVSKLLKKENVSPVQIKNKMPQLRNNQMTLEKFGAAKVSIEKYSDNSSQKMNSTLNVSWIDDRNEKSKIVRKKDEKIDEFSQMDNLSQFAFQSKRKQNHTNKYTGRKLQYNQRILESSNSPIQSKKTPLNKSLIENSNIVELPQQTDDSQLSNFSQIFNANRANRVLPGIFKGKKGKRRKK